MITDFDLQGHLRSLEVSGQSQIGLKFKYEQFTKKTYLGTFIVCIRFPFEKFSKTKNLEGRKIWKVEKFGGFEKFR